MIKALEFFILLSGPFAFVLYAYTHLKMRWYLEEKHTDFVAQAGFPVKMSKYMYMTMPSQAVNWFRFVFSKDDLDDPRVPRLKLGQRVTALAALGWIVLLMVFALLEAGQ